MERERLPNFDRLMSNALDYLDRQLYMYPQFYPFIAAKTALKTMEKIIEGKIRPPDSFAEFDVGLLTAKSIDQIDFQNSLILHEFSYAFLKFYYPQSQDSSGSGWNLAFKFYSQEGYQPYRIYSHLRCIDFNKPLEIHSHFSTHIIQQWRVDSFPQGDYYSEVGIQPTSLGINPRGIDSDGNITSKSVFKYQIQKQIEMLKSIAAGIIDFWSIPGTVFQTKGTGVQYFKYCNKSFLKEI